MTAVVERWSAAAGAFALLPPGVGDGLLGLGEDRARVLRPNTGGAAAAS